MKYRYLGRTGLNVSEISFGTQTFGWTTGSDEAFKMLDHYIAEGGNYLDTADSYNDGASEEMLGQWLKRRGKTDDLIVGTKVFFNQRASVSSNESGHSKKHIVRSLERSLTRLGIEAVDLYQLHCIDRGVDLEILAETMDDLVRGGKIIHYGLSNFPPSAIMKLVMLGKCRHFHQPATLQLEYSLLVRSPEWELLPVCQEEHIGTLAWSPLAGGWLTGKYKRNVAPPENSRVGRDDRDYDQPDKRDTERTWDILRLSKEIAEKRGIPVSHVALNWLRRKGSVSTILIGARILEQLKENLSCTNWDLSDEEEMKLDEASREAAPYPYSFIDAYSRDSYIKRGS
jgi:aryl-alcohol dehydrogenase-like predicted oxidoreductase